MKWNTLMTVIGILMAVASLTGSLQTVEGGSTRLILARDPFYSQSSYCNVDVNLYSPVENSTYYINNVLLNVSVIGADNCYYKTSGGWNIISCNYENIRTLTNGFVTLTVRGESGLCSKESSVTFYVVERRDYWGYLSYTFMMWIFVGCVLLLMWVMYFGRRNKKMP